MSRLEVDDHENWLLRQRDIALTQSDFFGQTQSQIVRPTERWIELEIPFASVPCAGECDSADAF